MLSSLLIAALLTTADAKPFHKLEVELTKRGCLMDGGEFRVCVARDTPVGCERGDTVVAVHAYAHYNRPVASQISEVLGGDPRAFVMGRLSTGHTVRFDGRIQCLPKGVELVYLTLEANVITPEDQMLRWDNVLMTPEGCAHQHDPKLGWNHEYEEWVSPLFGITDEFNADVHLHLTVGSIKAGRGDIQKWFPDSK